MSPNSQKNLGKGRKGNNHAKKDYSITRIMKEMLDQPAEERWLSVEDKGQKVTYRQAIAKTILVEAVRGNAKIIGEVLDRLEGKVDTTLALANRDDKPLKILFVPAGKNDTES